MKGKRRILRMLLWGSLMLGVSACGTGQVQEPLESVEETTLESMSETESGTVPETMSETMPVTSAMTMETDAVNEIVSSEVDELDQLVAEVILEQNAGHFMNDECPAEGHIILEEEVKDGILTVYALTMYGEYAFQNVDYFIKSAGTGVIPTVMQFDLRWNSKTPIVSIEYPENGSDYDASVRSLFPEHLWDRVRTICEEDQQQLKEMERGYAKRYLEELGRDAVIGEYADMEHTLLTDLGISVEVSNRLLEYEKNMGPYPSWHGSCEKLEDGVRYMYLVFYEEETGEIIYEKRVFDTMETVEKFVYDAETGEAIME